MTPAHAQYGQYGQALPHTGIDLTALGMVGVLTIIVGMALLFVWSKRRQA